MTNKPAKSDQALRRRAEERFRADEGANPDTLSPEETKQLLHELRVHQIELEMQNKELRRTQHELEASRTRYFDLYDLAPVGYLTVSEEGLIREANLAAATMLGLERKGLLQRPVSRFIFRQDQNLYYLHRKKAFEVDEEQVWEMRLLRGDGTHFWARLQATPAHNGEYWITLTGITKRKQVENELNLIFDLVPDMVCIATTDGRFNRVNSAFVKALGFSEEELLTTPFLELIHPDDRDSTRAEIAKHLSGDYTINFNNRFRCKDGSYRLLEWNTSPVVDETLLYAAARDITERRQIEETLALKQQQLEDLNRSLETRIITTVTEIRQKDDLLIQQGRLAAMGEMINNIAHQWRQPLNNLGLIIQNLQLSYEAGEMTAEAMEKDVARAMGVILYLSGTIDDFRNFFGYEKEPSDFIVNQVVSRALGFVLPTLKSSDIKVELDEEPDIPAEGFPNEYLQALLNILNNAKDVLLELKTADPLISIRICRENSRSVVTIRDNGGGISEAVLPKIFDPYFTTKEHDKGTGIGLYMSKAIIEKSMGGRLSVSNVAGGAEFRIEV